MNESAEELEIYNFKHDWYVLCTTEAYKHEIGSFAYTFWWSIRMELSRTGQIEMWARDPGRAFNDWLGYFIYKWDDLAPFRVNRGEDECLIGPREDSV